MILKENQVCHLAQNCPYNRNNECYGAKPNRPTEFTCDFVVNGKILDGGQRIPGDQTGKMKLIVD